MKKVLSMALSLTLLLTLFTFNTYAANYDYGDYYKGHKIIENDYNTYPVLRRGDTGELVEELQRLLNFHLYISHPRLDIDGIFGSKTENHVIDFQDHYAISVDGIVGPETWLNLY